MPFKTSSKIRRYLTVHNESHGNKSSNITVEDEKLFDRLVKTRSLNFLRSSATPRLKNIIIPDIPTPKHDHNKGPARSSITTTVSSSSSSMCSCCHAFTSHSSSLSDPDCGIPLSPSVPECDILCPKSADKRIGEQAQTWSSIFSDTAAIYDTAESSPMTQVSLPQLPVVNIGCIVDIFEALQLKPMDRPSPIGDDRRAMLSATSASPSVSSATNPSPPQNSRERLSLVTTPDNLEDSDKGRFEEEETGTPPFQNSSQHQHYKSGHIHNVSPSKRRQSIKRRSSNRSHTSPTSPSSASKRVSVRQPTSSKRNSTSKWNLAQVTGNMADLFRFAHTDADEMLTPERVLQKKVQLETERAKAKVIALNKVTSHDSVMLVASTGTSFRGDSALIPEEPEENADDEKKSNVTPSSMVEKKTSTRRPFSFEFSESANVVCIEEAAVSPIVDDMDSHHDHVDTDTQPSSLQEPMSSPRSPKQNIINPIVRVRSTIPRRGSSNLATIDEVSPLTPGSTMSPKLSARYAENSRYKVNKIPGSRNSTNTVSPLTPSPKKSTRSSQLPFRITPQPISPQSSKHTDHTSSGSLVIGTNDSKLDPLSTFKAHINGSIPRQVSTMSHAAEMDELISTPYSLTWPYFRHGQIRLNYSSSVPAYDIHDLDLQATSLPVVEEVTQFSTDTEMDISELCEWWTEMDISYGTMVNCDCALTFAMHSSSMQPLETIDQYMRRSSSKASRHNRNFSQTVSDQQDICIHDNLVPLTRFNDSFIESNPMFNTLDSSNALPPSHLAGINVIESNQWYRKSGVPSALRIGYAATPVRDAFARRQRQASYGVIEPQGDPLHSRTQSRPDSTVLDVFTANESAVTDRIDSFYDTESYGSNSMGEVNDDEKSAGIRRPSKDSNLSGPDSPMIDYSANVIGIEEEVIPMGFNLTHDIGDYLRWEMSFAEMSYAEKFE